MASGHLSHRIRHDTISALDPLRLMIWGAAGALVVASALLSRQRLPWAAIATGPPFLTLALVLTAGFAAEAVGMFKFMAQLLIPERIGRTGATVAVLVFTALISGLVNLDVAVVVAVPVVLRVAQKKHLPAGLLVIATAITANATSFLLPTSNLTNLLVLSGAPLATSAYVGESWMPWIAVTMVTIAVLTIVIARRTRVATVAHSEAPRAASRLTLIIDLVPMYAAASAIRALLGTGLVVGHTLWKQLALGSLLAAGVNNLPAAAAVQSAGASGRWALILAMALGPNLVLTGSIASVICRRLAHEGQADFRMLSFSLMGLLLLPMQLLVAVIGLQITNGIPS